MKLGNEPLQKSYIHSKTASALQCKWVLRKKTDSSNMVRYRARLVAKVFMQMQGVDYAETFSPDKRHSTLRLLFACAVYSACYSLYIITSFLNTQLK